MKFVEGPTARSRRAVVNDLSLDVRRDNRGEYFLITRLPGSNASLTVLDVQPGDRHLVLMSREGREKHRFLLGHDERHWFVAAIPESIPVTRVRDAKQALKPAAVLACEVGMCMQDWDRRVNARRVRQGEWFFVPTLQLPSTPVWVLRNEPLVRSNGGKPHMCEELYRYGGDSVYVSAAAPAGLTQNEYAALSEHERNQRKWRIMRRNAKVFARGRVRHPDHKTVFLDGWHEVFSNTENLSAAMKNVVFLD